MIPKVIHYCWFGKKDLPKSAQRCMTSWKEKCPDYKIVKWSEENISIDKCPQYVREAYSAKKWAFVSDYVRLLVIYQNGGIYLDTDVELLHSFDDVLDYSAFFGFENSSHVATGLGFGAEKGNQILKAMMDEYERINFINNDGSFDLTPCPVRNTRTLTEFGLVNNGTTQVLASNILILSPEFLCPISYETGKKRITNNTISIHWFDGSWLTDEDRKAHKESRKIQKRALHKDRIKHLPNRIAQSILGKSRYEILKNRLMRSTRK